METCIVKRTDHEADVIIVGGGIAGCSLAVAMGRQGRRILLIEQNLTQPNRIVGELLQPGGVLALEKLGLLECVNDIDAVDVKGYDIFYHGSEVTIPYPKVNYTGNTKAIVTGKSFHHGKFVQRLRSVAQTTANVIVIEAKVTELVRCSWANRVLGVKCINKKGQEDCYFGSLTILANGYDCKFRNVVQRNRNAVFRSRFWGLLLSNAKLPMPGYGHVILSESPPVLLYQISSNETRILVDIPLDYPLEKGELGGVKAYFRKNVLTALPASVQPALEDALNDGQTLRSMPNSWLPSTVNCAPGIVFVGDSLNMRHPLTGAGMTVALNDIVLLAEYLSPMRTPDLHDTRKVLLQMRIWHWKRKLHCAVLNILAQALYSLFAADDTNLFYLQQGCFHYFKLGGECVNGPISLLSALDGRVFVLVYHFFAVAVYSVWIKLRQRRPWLLLTPVYTLVYAIPILYTACRVILPYILAELKS